jgi:DNA-binding CsgD family transcriptional regulator
MATAAAREREVVGRDEELATVRAFLAEVERLPSAVFIEGVAGIGKTTLWRAGAAEAQEAGYRVLSARPAEAESHVSYAGLRDVFDPVLDRVVAELPPPQRRALEIALLLREAEEDAPDQAAIAFAVLGALRAIADTPVLVAVDDLQWLDGPSAFALRFAARRLRDEQIGFLLSIRTGGDRDVAAPLGSLLSQERTRHVPVGALSLGALHHLLQTRLPVVLSRPTLQRVHETSGGNPFFALELARALHQRGAEVPAGEPLPVPGELRELLRARLAALPRETEDALLFAAAMPQPRVEVVAAALEADPLPSLRGGIEAELIELEGDRIRFTHPLFASAVYSGTDEDRRREIHRRLAAVITDAEERARHLALGTKGVNPDVASALDDAARTARSRGAPQAAAELSELAFRLTPDSDAEAAHRRRIDAGAAHFEAGDTLRALTLFAEALESARSAPERAVSLVRLAWVNHWAGDQRLAVELFRECLAEGGADAALRMDAHDGLANSLFFLRENLADALSHSREAARLAKKRGNQAALAVALGTQGMIEAVLGRPEARRTLRSAVAIEEPALDIPQVMKRPSFQLDVARVWSDDLDAARADMEDIRQRAVLHGDESSLPFVLTYLSLAECLSGRLEQALRTAEEGDEVALTAGQEIGRAFASSARALAASCLGQEEAARSAARVALDLAERGAMFAETTSLWALGLLELALDKPADAHKRLGPLVERVEAAGIGEPGSIRFVIDDVEALVALGDVERARIILQQYEERARRLGRRSALAACARCRGLLAAAEGDLDGALAFFDTALESYSKLPLPLERARTLLALGAAQRKGKQRRAARATLEQARELFDQLGASLWSERARAELRRISGRAPSRGELTGSEQRVAELVAEGRTNKEVAAVLHLTERTVEGTLSRVYAKVGVRSRAELARRWADRQT